MANKKITALPALGATPATDDVLPIVDVSGTVTTKKITVANLVAAAPQGDLQASNNLSDVASAGTSRTNLGLGSAATTDSTDYATAAQGTLADSATQPGDLGTSAALDVGTSANNVVQLNSLAQLPAVDGSQLTGISTAVDGTAVTSTGQTGGTKFLREDGDGTCSFQTISITDENLRGTDNPHIGAFPNQSFKVLDNPSKSAMILADSNGSIKFIARDTSANVFVKKGNNAFSRLAEASELPSFIISKDSGEPDIELTDSDGEVYSVVSGDSDTLGANGIPARQGYQLPSIGANPAPLLISGGTIS